VKLLVLTPQLPYPPHQGTTLRNYNLLKRLASRHTIRLFSLLGPNDDAEAPPLKAIVEHLITAPQPQRTGRDRLRDLLLNPLPDMALRLWSSSAWRRLQQHVRAHPPDLIQVEGIEMVPYWLKLVEQGEKLPPVVYDAHNAEALLQHRAFLADLRRPRRWPAAAYSAIQTLKLQRYERQLLRQAAGIAAVSEADARTLKRLAPHSQIAVITNGVDIALYEPNKSYPNPYQHPGPNLVFTGKMDFRPNVDGVLWFAQEVMPHLLATKLNPHFWIVGKNPHPRLNRLRTRPDITITGSVPDILPYIAHADLYVVPLLAGGGTRLKILEAMAMAKPIVSTRLGADGFPVRNGEQLILADDPVTFAKQCRELLHDKEKATTLGLHGRLFVETRYNWDHIVPRLEQLYAQISYSDHH